MRASLQGAQVTTLFGTPEVRPKRKYSLLPLLVVVFLLSYGLMTLLIVEQSNTIESQRSTIQQLLDTKNQVAALQNQQTAQNQAAQVASAPTRAQDAEKVPVPAPSTQAVPSEKTSKAHSGAKAQRPLPEKPPTPTSDIADERRSLMSI
jgi:hypothetical protein